jgi:hypothetical protein
VQDLLAGQARKIAGCPTEEVQGGAQEQVPQICYGGFLYVATYSPLVQPFLIRTRPRHSQGL